MAGLLGVCVFMAVSPSRASAYLTALSLTTENPSRIASFGVSEPGDVQISSIEFPVSATDTHLIGLAFRPQSEDLYAMGRGGTLYVLRGPPWRAVQVNPTPAVSPLEGSAFSLAFNPVKDMISVIDDAGQNLLVNPFNGETSGDGALAFGPSGFSGVEPVPAAAAFIRSEPGLTATTMYVLDSATDWLAAQGQARSPEAGAGGTLYALEPLGLDITSSGGFASPQTPYVDEDIALLQPAAGGPQLLCGIETQTLNANGPQASCSSGRSLGTNQLLEGLAVVPPSVISMPDHIVEGTSSQGADVRVERRGALNQRVTVKYEPAAPSLHGSNVSGFLVPAGHITFEPGEKVKTFHVDIPDTLSARERGAYVELRDSAPNTSVFEGYAHIVARREGSLKVRVRPPKTGFRRVLRQRELGLRYACSLVCDAIIALRAGHIEVSRFAAHARSPGSHVATFELDRNARRAIRRHARQTGVVLRLRARFQSGSETVIKSLRFRLRR